MENLALSVCEILAFHQPNRARFEGLFYIVARVQKIAKQWQVKKNLPTTHPLSCRNIPSVSFMPSPTKEHKERNFFADKRAS